MTAGTHCQQHHGHVTHTASNSMAISHIQGLVRVDGTAYRILGGSSDTSDLSVMQQLGPPLVLPTATIYNFSNAAVAITLTFLSPMVAEDLSSSTPLTYIIWDIVSVDGKTHAVEIYFDFDAELCVNSLDEFVK